MHVIYMILHIINATGGKKRTRLGDQESQVKTAVLSRVFEVGFTKNVILDKRLDKGQGMSDRDI